MADQNEKSIDETPISPIERRDSLEKHLQTRPDAKDLKDRHILLDTNAAPYAESTIHENACLYIHLVDPSSRNSRSSSDSVLPIA